MSDDLAFRIQLGIVLPKLKEKISADLAAIVDELVGILQQGTREGEELTVEPIKEILMKDLEIFVDECIIPDVQKKIAPPKEEIVSEEGTGEGGETEEQAHELRRLGCDTLQGYLFARPQLAEDVSMSSIEATPVMLETAPEEPPVPALPAT